MHKNRNQVDQEYEVVDKGMITNHTTYKYETPYKGPFVITQCFINGTVNLHCVLIKIRYNIHRINPYKYDTKVEDISSKNISEDVNK